MDNTDVKTPRKRGRPATGRKTEAEKIAAIARSERENLPQYGGKPSEASTEYIREALSLIDVPPVSVMDPVSVRERSIAYLQHCADVGRRPGVAAYALYLGIDRRTLTSYATGVSKAIHPDALSTIKLVYSIIDSNYENSMVNGDINVVAGIFLMRNNLQYTNVDTVEIVPKQPEMQTSNIDDVIAEYAKDDE